MSTNVYGDVEKFIQVNNPKGNVIIQTTFTPNRAVSWRGLFSGMENWHTGKPFSDASRKLLSRLTPPFIPEDEAIIFDCGIGGANPYMESGVIRVLQVGYENTTLKDGFFLATESRLIFGNRIKDIVFQTPFKDIKAIYRNEADYSLVLANNSQLEIRLTIPAASQFGLKVLDDAPLSQKAAIAQIERRNVEKAKDFLNIFMGFFNEIADENRRNRVSK
jgi:hypothetical protein